MIWSPLMLFSFAYGGGGVDSGDTGSVTSEDKDGDNFYWPEYDCDDNDPEVNPLADEICDGQDNDCDGDVDIDEGEVALPNHMRARGWLGEWADHLCDSLITPAEAGKLSGGRGEQAPRGAAAERCRRQPRRAWRGRAEGTVLGHGSSLERNGAQTYL